jgi:SAM-dependent methyltransferase
MLDWGACNGAATNIMALAQRQLEPEWLDELPAEAPEAVHSRRDLRLVNALMGNAGCLADTAGEMGLAPPRTLIELACGDGQLLVRLLNRTGWKPQTILLVDRQPVVTEATRRDLKASGQEVEIMAADVFDWLAAGSTPSADLIVTNLFLHHFTDDRLRDLLGLIAAKGEAFIACEPRRSGFALFNTRLLGLIGCNHVTRHDAAISVRAGFRGKEITRLWPETSAWQFTERQRGLFSHCLGGRKIPNPWTNA